MQVDAAQAPVQLEPEKVDVEQNLSCVMCNSLYIKANGEMPCWCHVGEAFLLDILTEKKLADPYYDLANHQRLQEIRYAFDVAQQPPFKICSQCAMMQRGESCEPGINRKVIDIIHVEASWLCNLDCPLCIPRAERKTRKKPPYLLELPLWESIIDNFQRNDVTVNILHLEGRGEPLMNPELPSIIRVFRNAYPNGRIRTTTNGNFPWRDDYYEAGLDYLCVSIDGYYPESYARYRRGGSIERALDFLRNAAEARLRLKKHVEIEWKYILFEWTDSDEEMQQAYALAQELGVELNFSISPWAGKSLRYDYESLQLKLDEMMPEAQNRPVATCIS